MPENEPSPDEIELLARFHKANQARLLWKCLAIFCVALWLLSEYQPQISYEFDPYNNLVIMRKSQWFHSQKTVSVTWRKDSDGELGWCAKDKDGHWYKFINEPPDDYAN